MNYGKMAAKGGTTGGFGAVGMLVEWIVNTKMGLGAPAGFVTAAVTALFASGHNWLKNRK